MVLTPSQQPTKDIRPPWRGRKEPKPLSAHELWTEKEFQDTVRKIARHEGWLEYAIRDSRGSPRGYPDLTLVRSGEVIWAELKKQKGIVSPEQANWLRELDKVPCTRAFVWRPSDMDRLKIILHKGLKAVK